MFDGSLRMDTTVYEFQSARAQGRTDQQQANADARARSDSRVAWSLRDGPLTSEQIQAATGLGNGTVNRSLNRLMKNDKRDRDDEPVVRCWTDESDRRRMVYALT